MSAATLTRPGRHRRRAGAYVAVLSVALLVSVIGLSALTVVRVQNRGAEGTNDLGAARLYAQAALELGLHWTANESNWRTGRGEGFWVVDQPIGGGTLSLEVNDLGANGLLESSSNSDPVLLTGTGVKGEARYKLSVTLVPATAALTCLEVSLHAGNDLIFDSATVTSDQIISANNSVIASGCNIFSDVEAANGISGGTYWGTRTTGITPRTMPNPSTVFDYYTTNGTYIDYSTLDSDATRRAIKKCVLSPASNPYGTGQTNAEGIYVIDCMSARIRIEDCRIVGTLVLLNPGSDSEVRNSLNWEPAVANYPALLIQGSMDLHFDASAPLDEGSLKVNFNPPGTPYPYPGGFADLDQSDSYPTLIKGLVYVSGDVGSSVGPPFEGVVLVGNTLTATDNLNLTYEATFLNNPPPGFAGVSKMVISPGSWRQVVD